MLKPLGQRDGEGEKEKGGKFNIAEYTNVIISTIITLVLLIVFTVVIYALIDNMMNKKFSALEKTQSGAEEVVEMPTDERGIVLDLGDFILNLADTNPRRFLKVNVAIELSKTEEEIAKERAPVEKKSSGHGAAAPADPMAEAIAEMEQFKPAIRDSVITVLTSKTSDELSTTTGKELAKEEIQDSVSSIFNGAREILRVSFGQFVIQ